MKLKSQYDQCGCITKCKFDTLNEINDNHNVICNDC